VCKTRHYYYPPAADKDNIAILSHTGSAVKRLSLFVCGGGPSSSSFTISAAAQLDQSSPSQKDPKQISDNGISYFLSSGQ
jgi:hypothetical protein